MRHSYPEFNPKKANRYRSRPVPAAPTPAPTPTAAAEPALPPIPNTTVPADPTMSETGATGERTAALPAQLPSQAKTSAWQGMTTPALGFGKSQQTVAPGPKSWFWLRQIPTRLYTLLLLDLFCYLAFGPAVLIGLLFALLLSQIIPDRLAEKFIYLSIGGSYFIIYYLGLQNWIFIDLRPWHILRHSLIFVSVRHAIHWLNPVDFYLLWYTPVTPANLELFLPYGMSLILLSLLTVLLQHGTSHFAPNNQIAGSEGQQNTKTTDAVETNFTSATGHRFP